jgi:hypothetical protein
VLLAPVMARFVSTELLPKQHLRQGHDTPESPGTPITLTRALEHVSFSAPRLRRGPSIMRMVPLPQQAGGGVRSFR